MCENEAFYARYDNFPANPGHIEIVPKRHIESFFELNESEILSAYELIHEAKDILDEKYLPEAYTIGINDGKAAGRTIDHLHIHIIPRHQGDVADPRGGIRRAAPNCDPDTWK
ncbi:AP-4-A phosphorylase [Actinomadura sp. RB68]|uniref:AP-4-A phosphorylase n=2 Tax=Actinomadura macrotermitis TaxID=2585200 RepID=A0A7K0BVH1_9ACTN|nr:AP-4-A phosphorylase [Actinomadura macrotermitis]